MGGKEDEADGRQDATRDGGDVRVDEDNDREDARSGEGDLRVDMQDARRSDGDISVDEKEDRQDARRGEGDILEDRQDARRIACSRGDALVDACDGVMIGWMPSVCLWGCVVRRW